MPRARQVRPVPDDGRATSALRRLGRTGSSAGSPFENGAAWRFPATINPHLFVSQYTAVRPGAVSGSWISQTHRIPAPTIREDRILAEALVSRGDVRRLGDLFGPTVGGAERYAHTTDPPGSSI